MQVLRFLLAFVVLGVLPGCGRGESGSSDAALPRSSLTTPRTAAAAGDRRHIASENWRELWRVGTGTAGDTSIIQPVKLAASEALVFVLEPSRNRVTALRRRDGSLAWFYGSYGSGTGQLADPMDLAVMHTGDVVVADPMNERIVVLTDRGALRATVPLENSGQFHSFCALPDSTFLLFAFGAARPFRWIDWHGRTLGTYEFPWKTLASLGPGAQQGLLAPANGEKACFFALQTGGGFAKWTEQGGFIFVADYVESKPSPQSGYGTALALDADRDTLWVSFEGSTTNRLRIVDGYRTDDGRYARSFTLPSKVFKLARSKDALVGILASRVVMPIVAWTRADATVATARFRR